MAYDTKVFLKLISQQIALSDSVKSAYKAVQLAASVEGVQLPNYEDCKKSLREDDENTEKDEGVACN